VLLAGGMEMQRYHNSNRHFRAKAVATLLDDCERL